jgi:hypothetical protein
MFAFVMTALFSKAKVGQFNFFANYLSKINCSLFKNFFLGCRVSRRPNHSSHLLPLLPSGKLYGIILF